MATSDDELAASLTTDEALDLLADAQRRRALLALRDRDGTADLAELAAATAARTDGCTPDEVAADRRARTAAMLHHAHLPRLADADVVEYDPEANRVERTAVADALDPYFELLAEQRPSDRD